MRVCCQACQCPTVIKCSVRADARSSAPVAFVYRHAVLGATPHRFQTWCLPRTFRIEPPRERSQGPLRSFRCFCSFVGSFGMAIPYAARRPEGRIRVSSFRFQVETEEPDCPCRVISCDSVIEPHEKGPSKDIIINKMSGRDGKTFRSADFIARQSRNQTVQHK
jgi:hypothetical protein